MVLETSERGPRVAALPGSASAPVLEPADRLVALDGSACPAILEAFFQQRMLSAGAGRPFLRGFGSDRLPSADLRLASCAHVAIIPELPHRHHSAKPCP